MKEPLAPLLDSADDALQLALLRSTELDLPSPNLLPKAAAALGVAALLGSASHAAAQLAASSAARAVVSGTPASAGLGSSFWLGVLKPLAIGTAVGMALSGAASVVLQDRPDVTESHSRPARPLASEPQAVAARAVAAPVPQPPPVPERAPAGAPFGRKLVGTNAPAPEIVEPKSSPPREAAPASVSIAAEVAMLDRARALLRSNEPLRAARVVEQYRARWPEGVLAREASVLMVEALVGAGNRAEAESEAERSGLNNQADRYAARVRELLGKASR
jgi:hypothetical protein